MGARARDGQAVLIDLQFDVVPGDPGKFGLDQVELLGLVDLDVRLPGRLLRALLGDLLVEPSHALPQVFELAAGSHSAVGSNREAGNLLPRRVGNAMTVRSARTRSSKSLGKYSGTRQLADILAPKDQPDLSCATFRYFSGVLT
jgi:hypothetical protein